MTMEDILHQKRNIPPISTSEHTHNSNGDGLNGESYARRNDTGIRGNGGANPNTSGDIGSSSAQPMDTEESTGNTTSTMNNKNSINLTTQQCGLDGGDTAAVSSSDKAEANRAREKVPEIPRKKRVSDVNRVQKVLEELSTKFLAPDQPLRCKRQRMGSDARALLLEYAKEMSAAVLEESCLLARHRKSKEINVADVKLIFGE